jgi:cytochrome c-type biogenesis protein
MTDLMTKPEASPSPIELNGGSIGRRTGIAALALVIVFGVGLGILLSKATSSPTGPDATVLSQAEMTDRLLRTVGDDSMTVDVLYTPSWYFEWSGRSEPRTDGSPAIGFLMFETVHTGVLASDVPDLVVTSDGVALTPMKITVVEDSDHHRVSQLLFAAEDGGRTQVHEGDLLAYTIQSPIEGEITWSLNDAFGVGLLGTEAGRLGITSGALTIPALLAIFGGMLTALSPCLLLLATYYTAVLAGAAASGESKEKAGRKMVTTALWFIIGFTVIYTTGGVFAGYVGESLSRLENIGDWARPVSIIAGAAVILLGLRVAAQANVPVVCKMPGFRRPAKRQGWAGSAMMGSTFAVGCLSCFSATVLSALLLYAGATGSPVTGGLVMLVFSAAVGIIFLLAAWLVTKAVPLVQWMEKARPVIGGVSAVIMIALGLLMVTYNFHLFTGWMLELWN